MATTGYQGNYWVRDLDKPMELFRAEWRPILELRSVKDKIGIPIDCELLEPGDLNIVSELVREGIIVWIDRAVLKHLVLIDKRDDRIARIGVNTDVYQLTLKGIKLCNDNGIAQQ